MKKMMKIQMMIAAAILAFTLTSANAQTYVSGGIYANTTWTKANSPYIVTDTVVVFPGVTLTIQPGVVVKFDNKMRLEIRQATLIAQGTAADSITFTSNSGSPTIGSWGDVNLNNPASTPKFNYCNILYSSSGLNVSYIIDTIFIANSKFTYNNSSVSARYLLADYCEFNNNNTGLFAYSYIFADNCFFNNNDVGILLFEISIIKNSTFYNHSYAAVEYNGVGSGSNLPFIEITNSTFKNNYYGVKNGDFYLDEGIPLYMDNCNISNNQIGINNENISYYYLNVYKNKITNCIIDSNIVYGIASTYNDYDSIINCQIKNNGTGIYSDYGSSLITMNTIENNNVGIQVNHTYNNNIYCNKICNNTTYDFVDSVAYGSNINIKNNYWCTTDSATIATKIYDGYDNVNLSLVTFLPIDTTQCYLTGCALQVSATVTNATCDTCLNGSATAQITNGFPPYVYTWYSSPMQSTATATGLAPGYYNLCVTDSKGCTACNPNIFIDSTNCTGFGVSTSSANATCSTCADGKAWVNVSGGTPPYNYTWYTIPMQSTDTAFSLTQGTYNVCVTDLYGCTACDSVTVAFGNCSAHFVLYPDTTILHHYYAVNMASGTAPLSYSWDWGDGTTSTGMAPSHTYANAGFYNICLTIVDAAGCSDTYCNSFYLQKGGNTVVTVDVILITGIDEIPGSTSLNIFPNPASSVLSVELGRSQETSPSKGNGGSYKVYNYLGTLVSDGTFAGNKFNLDVSGLAKGLYLLKVEEEVDKLRPATEAVKRFIKE